MISSQCILLKEKLQVIGDISRHTPWAYVQLSVVLIQRETLEKLVVMPPRQFSVSFDCVFQSFRSFPEEMRLLPHAPDV